MIRRLLTLSFIASLPLIFAGSVSAAGISYPEAAGPNPDHLITPPGENGFFPMRNDGQAFSLQIDSTNNLTDYMNRHYYDFRWDGATWSPWDTMSVSQKGVRLSHLWPEYNEANQFHLFNGFNVLMERLSGFGPGPGTSGKEYGPYRN
ncbi:MAG: hypothetical protein K2X27_20605 [Candidatus Obscuribacterales bacterium]|nr:hypothetical protein [Candidatus Obscuribacterales bacterium]